MKKNILTLLLISVFGLNLNAQTTATTTDTIWRTTLLAGLNLNQLSFTNWSAGGENSFSGNALLSYTAKYKKGRWGWDNVLDFAIGATKTGSDDLRKSDDKIDINSKLGYNFNKNFYLSYLLGFKSQFTEGFLYEGDNRARISNFLAPGYVLNAVGVDWKANDDVSIFISPATLKTTIVQDDELSAAGQFGVDPGEKIRNELGAYFILRYKYTVMENVDFSTKLELFSSYTNNPQNIDVNWEVLLSFKVNKYINALLQTQLIYDDDVVVPKGKENPRPGIGTQFKEVFGIGFSYKFEGAAVK